jgi:hypothetical protein
VCYDKPFPTEKARLAFIKEFQSNPNMDTYLAMGLNAVKPNWKTMPSETYQHEVDFDAACDMAREWLQEMEDRHG